MAVALINRRAELGQSGNLIVTGLVYLMIIIIGPLYGFLVEFKIMVAGDSAATVNNILEHEMRFRVGIILMLVMYALVIVLSWALYLLLKPVNQMLALLALLFRFGEALTGIAVTVFGLIVLSLLQQDNGLTGLEGLQVQALIGVLLNAMAVGLSFVLLLIGLGGSIFCTLFFFSKYVPRLLAGWGILTYLSMLGLAFLILLLPDHQTIINNVLFGARVLFELTFGFWLLFKGFATQF